MLITYKNRKRLFTLWLGAVLLVGVFLYYLSNFLDLYIIDLFRDSEGNLRMFDLPLMVPLVLSFILLSFAFYTKFKSNPIKYIKGFFSQLILVIFSVLIMIIVLGGIDYSFVDILLVLVSGFFLYLLSENIKVKNN